MTEAALVEGQVKLRDGKKVGAPRGRRAGARGWGRGRGAGAHGRPLTLSCLRSGRIGGWCCASHRRWQVSGWAGGGRVAASRRDPAGPAARGRGASSPEIAAGEPLKPGPAAVTGESQPFRRRDPGIWTPATQPQFSEVRGFQLLSGPIPFLDQQRPRGTAASP